MNLIYFLIFPFSLLIILFLGVVPVTATYPEFVSFVQKFLIDYNNAEYSRIIELRNQAKKDKVITNMKEEYVEYKLSCGHLFDRLITEYVITEAAKSSGSGGHNATDSISELHQFEDVTVTDKQNQEKQREGEVNVVDKAISVVYMLVVLNMAVKSNAEERVESLFKTAQMITKMKETSHNMAGIGGGNDNEGMDIGVNEGKVEEQSSGSFVQKGEGEGVVESKDKNMDEYISVDSAHRIVDHLIQSWQVGILLII
jgi:hypothetical protein